MAPTAKSRQAPAIPRRGRPTLIPAEKAGNATVLVGLELLKRMAKGGRALALTEIAAAMDMSASRTHRYLSSVLVAGFVRKDDETGRYDIGPATIEIGIAAMERVDAMQVAAGVMRELTNETGLCSYLCIWGSNGPTVIRSELGSVQTAVRVSEGTNLSLLTATGQIFHTFMPHEKTIDLLKRDIANWNAQSGEPPVTLDQAVRPRARVLKMRIARTRGMQHPTWTAFSCPVFDRGGRLRMALTLIGVSALFDTRLDGAVAQSLKAVAEKLSALQKV